MRELLANGVAEITKGRFALIQERPYIEFEYAPQPTPDYEALYALIYEYGLTPVDKVPSGGGLWLAGDRHDEMMKDFVRESRGIG